MPKVNWTDEHRARAVRDVRKWVKPDTTIYTLTDYGEYRSQTAVTVLIDHKGKIINISCGVACLIDWAPLMDRDSVIIPSNQALYNAVPKLMAAFSEAMNMNLIHKRLDSVEDD